MTCCVALWAPLHQAQPPPAPQLSTTDAIHIHTAHSTSSRPDTAQKQGNKLLLSCLIHDHMFRFYIFHYPPQIVKVRSEDNLKLDPHSSSTRGQMTELLDGRLTFIIDHRSPSPTSVPLIFAFDINMKPCFLFLGYKYNQYILGNNQYSGC